MPGAVYLDLWPLTLMMLGVVGFSLYVFIHTPTQYRLKVVLIPLVLFIVVYSFNFIGNMLGYSVRHKLPEQSVYIAHAVVITQDGAKTDIEVWLRSGNRTRLFLVPYSKQMEKVLDAAREASKDGTEVTMTENPPAAGDDKGKGKSDGVVDNEDEYPYNLNLNIPSYTMPKQPI